MVMMKVEVMVIIKLLKNTVSTGEAIPTTRYFMTKFGLEDLGVGKQKAVPYLKESTNWKADKQMTVRTIFIQPSYDMPCLGFSIK